MSKQTIQLPKTFNEGYLDVVIAVLKITFKLSAIDTEDHWHCFTISCSCEQLQKQSHSDC